MRSITMIGILLAVSGCTVNLPVAPSTAPTETPLPANLEPGAPVNTHRIRGAATGKEESVDYFLSISPDCSSNGYPDIRIVTPPTHGTISSRPGVGYSNFPKDNARAACNAKQIPVTYINYRSQPGFVGTDTATIEVLFPLGRLNTVDYAITVR
jgi:hypothetical protein